METIFDIWYLLTVISLGIIMLKNSNKRLVVYMFGFMAVLLGCGDAFHLVPRAYALWSEGGLPAYAFALGFGKFVTSISMTVFYAILYRAWRVIYKIQGRHSLDYTIYLLATIRIVLCILPQNMWFDYNGPMSWAIYRNIPFLILGLIIIFLFYSERNGDIYFKNMWLAVTLSFSFYLPVVLFSNSLPIVGILMMPKTLAYVWIVHMGYNYYKGKVI